MNSTSCAVIIIGKEVNKCKKRGLNGVFIVTGIREVL
jgi:hypothetical protein